MTVEQKAKRYDEALERARIWKDKSGMPKDRQGILDDIFPELKESEDEKIRKAILAFIRQSSEVLDKQNQNNMIAWLEKQGEQKSITIDINKMVSKYSHTKDGDFGLPINCQIRAYRKGINDALNLSLDIKKQGERKSADSYCQENCRGFQETGKCFADGDCEAKREAESVDKVEPKFHEGDWIVQGYNILKIKCVGNTHYCFETVGGYVDDMLISEIDSQFHLWTIQDAKDGDVLLASDGSIFIFAGVDDCACKYYVALTADNYVKINKETKGGYWETSRAVHPATKEQRDTLFAKMHEAEYDWDAEKKKLKKIDWNKHIKYEPNCPSIIEENTKWSEEDEYMLDETIQHLKQLIEIDKAKHCGCDVQYYQRDIDWLESLHKKNK